MGSRNPDRVPRLRSLVAPIAGSVRLAVCRGCGHRDALPLDRLIRRFGLDYPVGEAVWSLKCSACGVEHQAEARLARLCEPWCRRQRG